VDICSVKFWQGGFDMLEKLVSELEKLPVESKSKAKSSAKVKAKKIVAKKPSKAKPTGKRAKIKK
jgi:hypothetical protein